MCRNLVATRKSGLLCLPGSHRCCAPWNGALAAIPRARRSEPRPKRKTWRFGSNRSASSFIYCNSAAPKQLFGFDLRLLLCSRRLPSAVSLVSHSHLDLWRGRRRYRLAASPAVPVPSSQEFSPRGETENKLARRHTEGKSPGTTAFPQQALVID